MDPEALELLRLVGGLVLVFALIFALWHARCHRCGRRWAWHAEEIRVRDRVSRNGDYVTSLVFPLCRKCASRR
jgi:hypothetical protein